MVIMLICANTIVKQNINILFNVGIYMHLEIFIVGVISSAFAIAAIPHL